VNNWTFGDVLWSMLIFFFWCMFIWMFIAIFSDIFRRDDLSGWGKAGWILLIVVLPFLGILIYMIVRPKPTEAEIQQMAMARQPAYGGGGGRSAADEIAKAAELRDSGKITPAEFDQLKAQALRA
jgi:Phospholipase_D-nuclease N-terminal/Short C-terminal domain